VEMILLKQKVKERVGVKQAIQDRIEKINQGIVPEGYKQTIVGIIPKDWGDKRLEELSLKSGKYGINAAGVDYSEDFPRYLRITDISDEGRYIGKNEKSVDHKDSQNYLLNVGDIVFARTGNTTGKTYLYEESDGELVYAGFLIKYSINLEVANPKLIFYHTQTNRYWNWVKVMSARSGQPGINSKEYNKLSFPLASYMEQQKIADILATWDRAIELNESLIKEKVEQKKGLIQKLMSSDYMVGSKKVQLADVLDYQQPGKFITNNILEDGKIPVLTANKSFVLGFTDEKKGIYDDYPVIIFDDFTTDIKYVDFPFKVRSSAMKILKLTDGDIADLKYIYERMTLIKHPRGSHKRYYISEYQHINVNLPPLAEQKRIANILSTADREIELLKELVEELKEEKKGLMQLLLTGIIRVKGKNDE